MRSCHQPRHLSECEQPACCHIDIKVPVLRNGVRVFQFAASAVVVAHKAHIYILHRVLDALLRLLAVACKVAKADYLLALSLFRISHGPLERPKVAVYVAHYRVFNLLLQFRLDLKRIDPLS